MVCLQRRLTELQTILRSSSAKRSDHYELMPVVSSGRLDHDDRKDSHVFVGLCPGISYGCP
jgi:hypothetical protein